MRLRSPARLHWRAPMLPDRLTPRVVPPALHRLGTARHATWLELFFDLVFVVGVTQVASCLVSRPTWAGVATCIALFVPVVWAWTGHTVYATRFDTDDMVHRAMTLLLALAALFMAVQMPTAFGSGSVAFALAYVLARATVLVLYARAHRAVPEARPLTSLYLWGYMPGAACWAVSVFVPIPYRFALWGLGLAIDLSVPWLARSRLRAWPLDPSFLPERMGLFTLIVLGELIVATAHAFTSVPATPWNTTAAVLAFVLAIGLFGDYFSFIQRAGPACRLGAGQPFFYAHWPLLFGLIALSAGLAHAIRESAGAVSASTAALAGGGMALWLLAELLLHRLEGMGGSARRHRIVYLTAVGLVGLLMLAGPAVPAVAFLAGLVAVSVGVRVADA